MLFFLEISDADHVKCSRLSDNQESANNLPDSVTMRCICKPGTSPKLESSVVAPPEHCLGATKNSDILAFLVKILTSLAIIVSAWRRIYDNPCSAFVAGRFKEVWKKHAFRWYPHERRWHCRT